MKINKLYSVSQLFSHFCLFLCVKYWIPYPLHTLTSQATKVETTGLKYIWDRHFIPTNHTTHILFYFISCGCFISSWHWHRNYVHQIYHIQDSNVLKLINHSCLQYNWMSNKAYHFHESIQFIPYWSKARVLYLLMIICKVIIKALLIL